MKDEKLLYEASLFEQIEKKELQQLFQKVHFQIKKYKKEDIIVFQNSRCEHLYLLFEGSAVAGRINISGKYLLVEEFHAPKVIAPAFLFNKENFFPVSVTVVENSKVLIIPKDEFLKLLQKNSQLLYNFINIISDQVAYLSKKIKLANIPLRGKLAHFILSNCKEGEDRFTSIYTQQKLADIFGVTRSSVARCFADMEKEKVIIVKNKNIIIKNKLKLKEWTE